MATADIEIPKKYKAVVYDQPGKVSTKVEELETPEPGAGEILVNLYAAACCAPPRGPTDIVARAGLTQGCAIPI